MSDSDRVKLSYIEEASFGVTPSAVAAQGSLTVAVQPIGEVNATNNLTIDTNPSDGDTVTLGSKTYTFETVLTDVDGNIFIGASTAATQVNLENAVSLLSGTPGTDYALSMTANTDMSVGAFGAVTTDVAAVTALVAGSAGNSLATTQTFTAGTNVFDSATLLGGTDSDTFTLGSTTYTMRNLLVVGAVAQIQIGASLVATQLNIEAAINLSGTSGVQYSTGTTANAEASAGAFALNLIILTALIAGTAGDTIVTTSAFTSASNFFDAVTLGTTTAGADAELSEIRMTSETLKQDTDTGTSAEVRDDRQIADLIRTSLRAGGDINVETSFESHEDFLAAGLFSSGFSTEVTIPASATLSIDDSDSSLNDSEGGLITGGLVVGSWVLMSGWSTDDNNVIGKITSLTANKAVLRTAQPLVTEEDAGIAAEGTLTIVDQPTADTLAEGTLTLDTIPTDLDTMTIGSKTYTFQDTLTDVDGNIEIALTLAQTQVNIENAINLTGTPGTGYALSMSINPEASAGSFAVDDMILTSRVPGVLGNSIVTTQTFTAGTNVFDAVTLGTTTAGVDGDTITIDSKTYFYTDDASVLEFDGAITVGASVINTQDNTVAAINLTGTPGTDYSLSTTVHPTVSAGAFSVNDSIITANLAGTLGNSIVTVETFASANNFFDAVTLGTTTTGSGNIDSVTITQGSEITNGTIQRTFTIEREFTDLSAAFALFLGMIVDGFNFAVEAENIITGAFTFVGQKQVATSSTVGSGDSTELSTNPVMTAIEDTNAVLENGEEFATTQFSVAVANNTRARAQIGTEGAVSIGAGVINVTGALQAYFDNIGIIARYLAFTTSSLGMIISDAGGNFYVFDLPKVKYSDGSNSTPGQNSDVFAELEYTALRCPSENVTIRIVKFTGAGITDDC